MLNFQPTSTALLFAISTNAATGQEEDTRPDCTTMEKEALDENLHLGQTADTNYCQSLIWRPAGQNLDKQQETVCSIDACARARAILVGDLNLMDAADCKSNWYDIFNRELKTIACLTGADTNGSENKIPNDDLVFSFFNNGSFTEVGPNSLSSGHDSGTGPDTNDSGDKIPDDDVTVDNDASPQVAANFPSSNSGGKMALNVALVLVVGVFTIL